MAGAEQVSRSDEEIAKPFKARLGKTAEKLAEKKIETKDYQYDFRFAWKNDIWHLYEPVSFDLVDPGSNISLLATAIDDKSAARCGKRSGADHVAVADQQRAFGGVAEENPPGGPDGERVGAAEQRGDLGGRQLAETHADERPGQAADHLVEETVAPEFDTI